MEWRLVPNQGKDRAAKSIKKGKEKRRGSNFHFEIESKKGAKDIENWPAKYQIDRYQGIFQALTFYTSLYFGEIDQLLIRYYNSH